jgi:replicative DNA helicase
MLYNDEAAEYRLLGAIVDDPKLALHLKADLFSGERKFIFESMIKAYTHYEGELSYEGVERFYGAMLPPEIEISRGAKPAALIERLAELATKRQLLDLSNRVTVMLATPNLSRDEVIHNLQLPPIDTSEVSDLTDGVNGFVSDLGRKRSGTYKFVDTGLDFLNLMTGGEWPRQALSVLIGQAGGGKTALMCQSSLNMSRMGIGNLVISLEMPKPRIISRYVANMANVNGLNLRRGVVTNEELSRIDEALEELQTLPIYIIDNPEMSAADIVYQVKLHKDLYGIDAFFVDYLQIVSDSGRHANDMFSELAYVAQMFRNVAKIEDVSAIGLAQQNRQFKGLASIAGSSRIGQTADTVIEIKLDGIDDDKRPCALDFLKNRDGPVGEAVCTYRPKYLRFE